jgi:peptidoglycan hydrolase-like protein with peptidoglycan-binding domain
LGYYTGAIDGVYGAQTKAAVAQFQRSKQLQADGVVGSRTWSALQTASRPPQSEKPQSEEPQSEKPQSEKPQLAWQGTPQASPPTAPQIAWQTAPQASPPAASPAASATSRLQQDRSIDVVPESPFTYLWILGWGIIYGGGWVFILKDTVKELKGFHFVLGSTEKKSKETLRPMATHLRKGKKAAPTVVVIQNAEGAAESVTENVAESIAKGTVAWSTAEQKAETKPEGVFAWSTAEQKIRNKTENGSEQHPKDAQGAVAVATSVNHTPIDSQPLQAFFSIANDYTKGRSKNHSNGHSSQPLDQPLDQPAGVEEFALHDPWQEENEALSVQVFDVILADDGQVQPLQNVFVVAPRPTVYQRRRVKKPTPIIYDVKSIRQQVKTG